MRKFRVALFPNPEKKSVVFEVMADTIDIDSRGNVIFKTKGAVVGVVSNPAYQYVREVIEVNIVSK